MKRALSRFLPLIILLSSVNTIPIRDTGDREAEEDGILVDQALLRILEAEDELASVAEEIERLYEHREHTSSIKQESPEKDITSTDLEDVAAPEDLPMGDQPMGDQLQGDQPMEDLPQGDMPMDGPIDDNEAQEIGASPTPSISGRTNSSIPLDRQLQEFASGEARQIHLRKEFIRDMVWSYTRPGNLSETKRKKVDPEQFQRILRLFNRVSSDEQSVNQPKTQSGLQELLRSVNENNNNGITKIQSLFPSCEIPKNTDEEMWLPGENSFSMNVLFDFNQTKLAGNGLDVREATLRLYKSAQAQESDPWVTSCSLQNASDESTNGSNPTQTAITSENLQTSARTTRNPADQLVRVSVYLYTRALKKNRVKRKLLESRMITLNNDEWTAWNVLTAAKVFLQTRKNFGLLVEVEDENNCLLPAHRIFRGMNCSEEAATARPLPYPIMEAHDILNRDSFPIMDIRSYEIHPAINGPPMDVDILSTASSQTSDSEVSEQTLNTRPARRSSPTPTSLDTHRHRHGDNLGSGNHRRRRKPQNSTEEDDMMTNFRSYIIPQRVVMTAAEQRRRLNRTTPEPVTR